MSINISELLSIPSVQKVYQVSPQIEALKLSHGITYPVSEKEDFPLTLHKEDDELIIKADTRVTLQMPCDRCLADVSVTLPVHIDRQVRLRHNAGQTDSDQTATDLERDDDEHGFIEGSLLDADQLVRDELVLALPSKVLCKEDCRGLCSICGKNLNEGSCSCEHDHRDPRMAAIADLFREFQEE